MPTVSKKQERFMQAVAHNPKFAKKVGVPASVGKEFTKSGGGIAKSLGFVHPTSKQDMYFETELPEDMQKVLAKWRTYVGGQELE